MTGVYNKAKSEEVAPEISSAIIRACALFGVTFAKDLDRDASLADERDAGMEQGACARERFRRFCSLMAYFAPSVVPPFRENLTSNLGRRVRESSLSDAQGGVILSRGAEYLVALRKDRCSDAGTAVRVRDRDDAAQGQPTEHTRTK